MHLLHRWFHHYMFIHKVWRNKYCSYIRLIIVVLIRVLAAHYRWDLPTIEYYEDKQKIGSRVRTLFFASSSIPDLIFVQSIKELISCARLRLVIGTFFTCCKFYIIRTKNKRIYSLLIV